MLQILVTRMKMSRHNTSQRNILLYLWIQSFESWSAKNLQSHSGGTLWQRSDFVINWRLGSKPGAHEIIRDFLINSQLINCHKIFTPHIHTFLNKLSSIKNEISGCKAKAKRLLSVVNYQNVLMFQHPINLDITLELNSKLWPGLGSIENKPLG